MAIIQKTLFPENLEKYNTFVRDTETNSKYFKITELPDTLTGGKNAFLIQGSEYLVPDTLIKIEIKDSQGNIIYHEPGEGYFSSSFNDINGKPIITEYFEGVSKVVSVHVYPDTTFGPATITILGEVSSYDNNGLLTPIPLDWEGKYNVKWQRQVNINPALANTTKIRFYKRPTAKITEILSPIYKIENDLKVASAVTQSFANIKLSNLETFAGDVKRVKVFRTSIGDISDYDLIQDILVESKELLTSYGLSGSVVGNTGTFTSEVLKNQWNSGSLNATLNSTRVEAGVKLTGGGLFTYTQSLDLKSTNTYELNLDAFYSASTSSNLGVYLNYISQSTTFSSSIATLVGTQPTKNLLDTTIPFKIDKDYPTASLYFSQSQGEWHVGNISLKLSQDTAFSPDEVSFVTTMPTVLGNETFNFKFEFYDVNNNYVPVAVTQSATFNGGNTNIGGTILLISSSTTQLSSSFSSSLTAVSSSISGTVTNNSSSVSGSLSVVSGSVVTLSGSVSSSITTLSGSVSRSVALTLSSSLSKVKQLADGGFTGTFIDGTTIFAPVIGGTNGYISKLFTVGDTTAARINLDARNISDGAPDNLRRIWIGSGTYGAYNNTNTNVYLDSAGKFSLGNKLSYDGTNLSVNGSITITNPSTANNGGAVGSFSNGDALTAGSIAGLTLTSTKIHLGTGTHGNSNTGFYVDNTGKFSLKDKLVWDGTTLNIEGNIVITGGSTKTAIDNAASAASTAQTTADSKITGGQVNANVTSISGGTITTGTVAANRIDVAGVISAGGIIVGGGAAADVNNNSTTISGNKIRTGQIESNNFDIVFSDLTYALAGTRINLTNGAINSKNFYISSTGDAFFKGDISAATGTFTGGISGTGYTLNNSGLSLTNANSSISLGNGVTLSSSGLSGTGFSLNTSGVTATQGSIGGWTIGTNALESNGGQIKLYANDSGTGFQYGWIELGSGTQLYNKGTQFWVDYSGPGGAWTYREMSMPFLDPSSIYGVSSAYAVRFRTQAAGEGAILALAWSSGNVSLYGNGKVFGSSHPISSDRRLKDDIKQLDSQFGIEFLNKLKPVEYVFKDDKDYKKFGFIAQDVTSSLSEYNLDTTNSSLVEKSPNGDGLMHLNYSELISPLVLAIQQLSEKVNKLESIISGSINK